MKRLRRIRVALAHSEQVLVVLICIALLAIAVSTAIISRGDSDRLQLEISRARTTLHVVNTAWLVYSEDVVAHLQKSHPALLSHRHKEQPHTIPLPATFAIILSEKLAQTTPGQSLRLYSEYPFPGRSKKTLPGDPFAHEALAQLSKNPSEPFVRIEEIDDTTLLRYAEAVVMAPNCVDCHNTHPFSPRKDWKVGDVRGVFEVSQSFHDSPLSLWSKLSRRLFVVGVAVFLMAAVALLYLRYRRTRSDVEEQVQQRTAELSYQASIDGLTEIANRRCFDERLRQAWSAVQRSDTCLSLLMGDIDFFKRYNDHYGHPAGDACLRQIATVFTACAKRPDDLVARYGGEEFAVILPATDTAGAMLIAETIRTQVRNLRIPHADSPINHSVTLSIGVASCRGRSGLSVQDLLVLADTALYKAKAGGRDRCEAATLTADFPSAKHSSYSSGDDGVSPP